MSWKYFLSAHSENMEIVTLVGWLEKKPDCHGDNSF